MKKILITLIVLIALLGLNAIERNKVLVESGTGTWCPYCPAAAIGLDDLVLNGHPVAVIEYHNQDTFTNDASNFRNSYYSISSFPTVVFDGLNPLAGVYPGQPMYNYYLPRVNARLAIASHFTINATGSNNGSTYNITAVLDKVEPDTNTNLRFHAVVTESHIQFNWQGHSHLEFVERLMAPNYNGTTLNFGTETQLTVPLSFTMNPAWVTGNCELVLFIQNNSTKEVLQCVKYSFPELFGAYAVSCTEINLPDTYIGSTATFPVTINNYWSYPIIGSIVSDNPVFVLAPATRIDFNIPAHSSSTFDVSFTPAITSNETGNIIITSNLPDYPVINLPVTAYGFYNTAPVASAVTITGIPVATMMQTASYAYSDADNDFEGNSTYQWYKTTQAVPTPTPITGANGLTYLLTSSDIGAQLIFGVTPVDTHTMPGTTVMSEPSSVIEVLPAPQNLTAQVIENHDVVLNWQPPAYFITRDFLGYRVFRNGLSIATINNPSVTTFTDTWLNPGDYQYWLTSIFTNPISQSGPSNTVNINIVSNDDEVIPAVESVLIYPNPFRATSNLVVNSKANANVEINIYNLKGQLVHKMNAQTDANGMLTYKLTPDEDMLSGVYFAKVKTPEKQHTIKVILLK